MMRCRKRLAIGNTRNEIASTNATWIGRRVWVATIPYAVYRWNTDIATARNRTNQPSPPLSLLAAPSSSSM